MSGKGIKKACLLIDRLEISEVLSMSIMASLKKQGFLFKQYYDLNEIVIDECTILFISEKQFTKLCAHQKQFLKRNWVYLYTTEFIHESIIKSHPYDLINLTQEVDKFKLDLDLIVAQYIEDFNINLDIQGEHANLKLPLVNGEILNISPRQIKYIHAGGDYSDIIIEPILDSPKSKFTINENLKTISDRLKNMEFYRCHKSYTINLNWVKAQHPYPQNVVFLKDGIQVPLARRRKLDFYNIYRSISR